MSEFTIGRYLLAGAISLTCLISSQRTHAQISSDGTLPTNVTRSGNILEITSGATAGTNLFHSFQEFSVPTGYTAYFNNALNIQNIISRVTGSSISDIDGLIQANGTANLYLINPNGIIFGPNASLNIGGSFVASTASSIKFADGTEFSAVNSSAPPLLTISVPIGLQFNGNEGNIVVRAGSGSAADSVNEGGDAGQVPGIEQTVNTSGTPPRAISGELSDANDADLYRIYLPAGQPFQATTVGGSVVDTQLFLFDGSGSGLYTNDDSAGTLASTIPAEPFTPSASGTYYLGISSFDNDPISTNGLIFDYASATPTGLGAGLPLSGWDNQGQDRGAYIIRINGSRSSKAGGLQVRPGQTLALVGGQVSLEGATLKTPGGRVEIGGLAASGTVGLNIDPGSGRLSSLTFPAAVRRADVSIANSGIDGTLIDVSGGGGGSITINARNLEIVGAPTGPSFLNAGIAEGQGFLGAVAGDITLNATEAMTVNASNITSSVSGTGAAGNINIITGTLSLTNAAQMSTRADGQGDAGNLTIQANTVSFGTFAYVNSDVAPGAVGNGGNVTLTARTVSLTDGARISAGTFGQGNAGSVAIAADVVSFDGFGGDVNNPFVSGVFSTVRPGAVGKGGNITITARLFSATNSARVGARTLGQGNAGSVTIIADTITFDGVASNGFSGGVGSSVEPGAVGNAGNVNITARTLSLTNGAQVNTNTRGRGNAGNIELNVNTLQATGGSQLTTTTSTNGRAGNIIIRASDRITLSGAETGVLASTTPDSTGDGGSIFIYPRQITLTDGAGISADSQGTGNGGNLEVVAGRLILNNRALLTATTASGEGGNITLQLQEYLLMRNSSLLSATAGGSGNGGNIRINSPSIVAIPSENSDIRADAVQGRGGNVQITASGIFGTQFRPQDTPLSDITASSQFGVSGTVTINNPEVNPSSGLAKLSEEVTDPTNEVVVTCAGAGGNSFTITGRGGLPEDPTTMLRGRAVWRDLRNLSEGSDRSPGGDGANRANTSVPNPEARSSDALPDSWTSSRFANASPSPRLVEATSWEIDEKGNVVLVARGNESASTYRLRQPNCQDLSSSIGVPNYSTTPR